MKHYRLYLILLLIPAFTTHLRAQADIITALQQPVSKEGKVTIHQEPGIAELLGTRHNGSEEKILKVPGYRVQVYAGNNSRNSRDEATSIAATVRDNFPDVKVYTSFVPPRWVCRAGDFQTIEEADAMLRKLKNSYALKEVFIIKEQVNIYL